MNSRTRTIAAAAAATAALAAGSTAAIASTTGAKPGVSGKSTSASEKSGHDQIVAAVAAALHISAAQLSSALRPFFAAGHADASSPAFAAAASSLGVSSQQLNAALADAKQSLAGAMRAGQGQGRSKAPQARSKAAEERQGHDDIVVAVAAALHVSAAQVSAALRPFFAAGHADASSPAFSAAARSLGVSSQQLNTALRDAKQSLAVSS